VQQKMQKKYAVHELKQHTFPNKHKLNILFLLCFILHDINFKLEAFQFNSKFYLESIHNTHTTKAISWAFKIDYNIQSYIIIKKKKVGKYVVSSLLYTIKLFISNLTAYSQSYI